MSTNPHLEQVRLDMERAKRAEDAKRVYNRKAKAFNDQLARYERLRVAELDDRLAMARAREKAQAEGNHTLAALLVSR